MSMLKALAPGLSGLSAVNPAGGTGGGGPGFSWGDYPGLQIRFDCSSNSANHMTVANSLVTQVNDQTGNGLHAVQANASLQPATVVLTGSLLGIQGNAVAYMQTAATFSDNASKTVFAVVKAPEGNTLRTFTGSDNARLGINATDGRFIFAGTSLTDAAYTANTLEIWVAVFNGASSLLYVNGGAAAASGNAGNTSTDTIVSLLARASGVQATDGAVGEYARFNRVLATSELNDIGTHLADKWSLTWTEIT